MRKASRPLFLALLAALSLLSIIVGAVLIVRTDADGAAPAVDDDPAESTGPVTDDGDDLPQDGDYTHRVYHKVQLDFKGPLTSETADPNPFTDYLLICTFTHEKGDVVQVYGFFAADGDAAETSAAEGDVWRCLFSPFKTGQWDWVANFGSGADVGVAGNLDGATAEAPDGETGILKIGPIPLDLGARDNRNKGLLQYVGKNHLRYSGTEEYFIGGGTDAPEGLLNYQDFDDTGNGLTRDWAKHIQDWNEGDPTWKGGKGKGLIGVINYLAEKGLNSVSFLVFSHLGSDGGVYPTIGDPVSENLRYNVGKLAQWDLAMDHMDKQGLMIHIKLQEVQSVKYWDDGQLGRERKTYYREIMARFGHHLTINWNLGEEVSNDKEPAADFKISYERIREYSLFIKEIDPYDHPIVLHTWPTEPIKAVQNRKVIADGDKTAIVGFSLQGHAHIIRYYLDTARWVKESREAGSPKVTTSDEQGPYESGILSDARDPTHFGNRTGVLWAHYMAGGAGHQTYFGFSFPQSDINVDDLRSRDVWLTQVSHALAFFYGNEIPFWDTVSSDSMTSNGQYVLYKEKVMYMIQVVYQVTTQIDLGTDTIGYAVSWWDPVAGGDLQAGTVKCVSGGGFVGVGSAPGNNWKKDWIVYLKADKACDGSGNPDEATPCKGAFIRVDSASDDCCLSANSQFTLVTPAGENPAGVSFVGDTGLCDCTATGGVTTVNQAERRMTLTSTGGAAMSFACAKPWEPPGLACVPTLVSLGGQNCIA